MQSIRINISPDFSRLIIVNVPSPQLPVEVVKALTISSVPEYQQTEKYKGGENQFRLAQ